MGRFHYADANFCLIEKLIEGVTGKSFTLLMEEKVLQPLGMTCSTYEVTYGKNISQGHDRNGETVKRNTHIILIQLLQGYGQHLKTLVS